IKLVHPDDQKLVREILENMVVKGVGCDVTKRLGGPAGDVRIIRSVGAPASEKGRIVRFFGTLIVVTEREQITKELRRSDAYLMQAQALSHTGSFGWNLSTGELVWSDETFQILDYKPNVKPTLDLVFERVHPDDIPLVRETISRASQDGKAFRFEHRLLMPDGSIKQVYVAAQPFED